MNRICLIFCLLSALWLGCEEGQPLDNQPPDTELFVDAINLSGDNRLNTVVRLHWLGSDRDGYVKGYEVAFDEGPWAFTTATDSIFRFDLGDNSDTADIRVRVRAIDNDDLADPTPDELLVPIKNSPPVARFDTVNVLPDTVRLAGTVLWTLDDLDGVETLDSVFVRLNDGPWRSFVPTLTFLSFLPESPSVVGQQGARLFLGTEAQELGEPLPGLRVGGDNRVYLRARDISGSFSAVDTSSSFFLPAQTSDLLVIAEHAVPEAGQRYRSLLDGLGLTYDWYDLQATLPTFWEPTFSLFLRSYDRVFWFSDGVPNDQEGEQLLLSVAAPTLQTHLNEGGKLLVTTAFPASYNDPEIVSRSLVFDFSPVDSLSSSSGQARIANGSAIYPLGEWRDRLDTLRASSFITSADPFYSADASLDMMETELIAAGGWVGPATVMARTRFNNGRTNQVLCSLELHRLDGDPAALETFFRVVLTDEFVW